MIIKKIRQIPGVKRFKTLQGNCAFLSAADGETLVNLYGSGDEVTELVSDNDVYDIEFTGKNSLVCACVTKDSFRISGDSY